MLTLYSWTDSQLKAFLDKHDIAAPQPRNRDSLLHAARSNYETVSKKTGEAAAYPGNWLYASWSESDLKKFLDERGIPAPQPTTRDSLIASVRRNARLASLKASASASAASGTAKSATDAAKASGKSATDNVKASGKSASAAAKSSASAASAAAKESAKSAKDTVSDTIFDSWSDSKIKEWADENGIKVPQGSNRNELLALARKHKASATGSHLSNSAASAYGAATSKVGNTAAKATDDAKMAAEDAFNSVIESWSNTRLKAYLDARGVPVPQSGKKDELLAAVRLQKHKAATGYSAWTFDTWTTENLR